MYELCFVFLNISFNRPGIYEYLRLSCLLASSVPSNMKLSFVLPDGRLVSLDTPSDTLMSSLRLMVSIEAGYLESNISLLKNEKRLPVDSNNTVQDCNLCDDDLLSVRYEGPQSPTTVKSYLC